MRVWKMQAFGHPDRKGPELDDWLDGSFCAVVSRVPDWYAGIGRDEIMRRLRRRYPEVESDRTHGTRATYVDHFFNNLATGDVVVVVAGPRAHVARVADALEKEPWPGGHTRYRRAVDGWWVVPREWLPRADRFVRPPQPTIVQRDAFAEEMGPLLRRLPGRL